MDACFVLDSYQMKPCKYLDWHLLSSNIQGATIRRDDVTGEIYIARVIHGGLADRSGEGCLAVLFFFINPSFLIVSLICHAHKFYTLCVSITSHGVLFLIYVLLVAGLLRAGDRLVEVNGHPVFGLEPEQIIQILVSTHILSNYMLVHSLVLLHLCTSFPSGSRHQC